MFECPKCKNTMGFVFGKCGRCGYNYISKQWETIKVNVDDLPKELQYRLIQRHEMYYEEIRRRYEQYE